ncbi:hypothetical protein [Streptomyces sp. NBC_01465]|uniref:hypothetical protein n=1 Tax=Streptomyces sp. NBC_01465 TaxID=2903878 RepID=UPI002E2FA779|nr:hypothetical protein [Streptomyces sp. NBC_01465]
MFDFGIKTYRPQWLSGIDAVKDAQGDRLRALVGRVLTGVWLVWDIESDEWFCDCPVLFEFEGEQTEINHTKFDDLSITWNSIDPEFSVYWVDFDLRWRQAPLPELKAVQGQTLLGVELLEWVADRDMASGMVAVSLLFPGGRVTVSNALDENGLDFGAPDPHYRRHSLG